MFSIVRKLSILFFQKTCYQGFEGILKGLQVKDRGLLKHAYCDDFNFEDTSRVVQHHIRVYDMIWIFSHYFRILIGFFSLKLQDSNDNFIVRNSELWDASTKSFPFVYNFGKASFQCCSCRGSNVFQLSQSFPSVTQVNVLLPLMSLGDSILQYTASVGHVC